MAAIFEKFSGFFEGPPWTPNPSKNPKSIEGILREGVGKKKV